MRKLYIVKKKQDFDSIIKEGQIKKNNSFIIYYRKNDVVYDRFGISVGKKLGNAVFRNLYKRKIRAIIDNYKKNYINGKDYIIILRRSALKNDFSQLDKDFNSLMFSIRKENSNDKE